MTGEGWHPKQAYTRRIAPAAQGTADHEGAGGQAAVCPQNRPGEAAVRSLTRPPPPSSVTFWDFAVSFPRHASRRRRVSLLKRLMYVTVYVSDQSRALSFYTDQLGLETRVDAQGPQGRFLTVAPEGASVEIVLWPLSPGPAPRAAVDPGAIVPGPVFLESDDLVKDFEELRSRGVIFVEPEPTPYPFGLRVAALDPDGNRVELRQLHRS